MKAITQTQLIVFLLRAASAFAVGCIIGVTVIGCGEMPAAEDAEPIWPTVCVYPEGQDGPGAPGQVEGIEISDGLEPTVTWNGGNAAFVQVSDEDGNAVWSVDCASKGATMHENCVSAPQTYGQTPSELEAFDVTDLEEGKRYELFVYRLNADDPFCGAGDETTIEFER